MKRLRSLGWDDFFAGQLKAVGAGLAQVGRVIAEDRRLYTVSTEQGDVEGQIPGKLLRRGYGEMGLPAVGDWVVLAPHPDPGKAMVRHILPRRSQLVRRQVGSLREQVLAANVDVCFIVQGLDANDNPRRLERYLTMAWDGDVQPVVVLNKTDICSDVLLRVAQAQAVAGKAPVVAVSALKGELDPLRAYLRPGLTFVLVGSSGVGKSTIVNALAGREIQATAEVSKKGSRGRHTTSRREMIAMPDGSLLIDTPGLRELQLWDAEEGLLEAFSDIAELALRCRFSDCAHLRDEGCAVRAAVERGELSTERYRNFIKLQQELAALEEERKRAAWRARWAASRARCRPK